jgi:hypothetical protein
MVSFIEANCCLSIYLVLYTDFTEFGYLVYVQKLNAFLCNDFIFSSRYQVWRHLLYWPLHLTAWAAFCVVIIGAPGPFAHHLINMFVWGPVYFLFSYPLLVAIPKLLLKGKVVSFLLFVVAWGVAGVYIESAFRSYVLIPMQEGMGMAFVISRGPIPFPYLCMMSFVVTAMIIKFFKLCIIKQRDWILAKQEKMSAELQLLKAQAHPHFLINTLKHIYSSSANSSPKTPGLILKLSSLLSYMLYDCKSEEVLLEKEVENMKNFINLEKERYGNAMEISWSVNGNLKDKFISPLLMLPLLENAFRHGISEHIEKPWLSVDLSVKADTMRCKIANSKYDCVASSEDRRGLTNVKTRLQLIYPDRHQLQLNDEGNFFVVSLLVKLAYHAATSIETPVPARITKTIRQTQMASYN